MLAAGIAVGRLGDLAIGDHIGAPAPDLPLVGRAPRTGARPITCAEATAGGVVGPIRHDGAEARRDELPPPWQSLWNDAVSVARRPLAAVAPL